MNNQLKHPFINTTSFSWMVDSVKTRVGSDSEIPLAQVLIISRVLFAIVMVGFIGYFFDRTKQLVFTMESKARTRPQVR